MAVTDFTLYASALRDIVLQSLDLDGGSFRAVLLTDSYSPNQLTDDTWSDASANEVTGTGYTAGGLPINLTVAASGLGVTVDFADVEWTNTTINEFTWVALVEDADGNGTLAGTDKLLAYARVRATGSLSTNDQTIPLSPSGSSVITITAAAYG